MGHGHSFDLFYLLVKRYMDMESKGFDNKNATIRYD